MQLDVTDTRRGAQVIDAVVRRWGRIDVLVNNAGRTQVGALEETTDSELRELFELHFFAPAALTRAVLPQMRRQGGGAVIQMSSVGGQVTAPGFGAYCATKFALEGLTQTLAHEVDFGVRRGRLDAVTARLSSLSDELARWEDAGRATSLD